MPLNNFASSPEHNFTTNYAFKWVCLMKEIIEWLQNQKEFFKKVTSFKSYDFVLNFLKTTILTNYPTDIFRWFTNFRICGLLNKNHHWKIVVYNVKGKCLVPKSWKTWSEIFVLGPKQSLLFEFPKISENFENKYLRNERSYEFQTNAKRFIFTCRIIISKKINFGI